MSPMDEIEASYVCQSCGEEIVVPVDPSAGDEQEYVEDCPVCCRPHVLRVHVDGDAAWIDARAE
ncbi:MAG: CPXCG motif-containing cysteine-rich protein [Planctomycetota bacterium]